MSGVEIKPENIMRNRGSGTKTKENMNLAPL